MLVTDEVKDERITRFQCDSHSKPSFDFSTKETPSTQ